jgi:5-methyltetrahydropteroyltriglutamate--homocysteine methyltransferase
MADVKSLAQSHVDHVGSLLRPQAVKDAFMRVARKEATQNDLDAVLDAAIREVVAKQEAHGLPVVTDGEYRRLNWQVSFSEIEGWDMWAGSWRHFLASPDQLAPGESPLHRGEDAVLAFRTPVTARLKLRRSLPLAEYTFLRSVTAQPVKVTLMGPDRVCQMSDIAASNGLYADADSLLADIVGIQKQMVTELVEAGCDYVQIDEPSYTGYVDPPTLERLAARGEEPLANLRRAVEADNQVIAGLKGRAVFGLHICRGNRASMWHREGTYDAIAETLFGGLAYDRLLLEYDSDRAGGFEPLRFVPKGVIAVLGLITTKSGQIEAADDLLRRIEAASRHLPVEQLALSPQCGFASGIGGNLLSEEEQWRKLDLMNDVASRVWG